MADDFISLKDAAALLGVPLHTFKEAAPRYGIVPLIIMGRPVYRRADIDICLKRLWDLRVPKASRADVSRSVRLANALISRIMNK